MPRATDRLPRSGNSQLEVQGEEFVAPRAARGVRGLLSIDISERRSDPRGRMPPPFKVPIDVSSVEEPRALVVKQRADCRLANGEPLLFAGARHRPSRR